MPRSVEACKICPSAFNGIIMSLLMSDVGQVTVYYMLTENLGPTYVCFGVGHMASTAVQV